jgi:hypothetical protein
MSVIGSVRENGPPTLPVLTKPPKPKPTETTVSIALAELEGLTQEGAGAEVEAAMPPNTRVLTTEDTAGVVHINYQFGTTKSAANKYFLCLTTLDDLQETSSRWILGKINNRTTKQSTAKKSSFTTNWHNYTIIKLLSGPGVQKHGNSGNQVPRQISIWLDKIVSNNESNWLARGPPNKHVRQKRLKERV